MINPIQNTLPKGKSNIPRYLYHLTTKDNYTSMLKDGCIKTSPDVYAPANINGVFMFGMINFIKRWFNSGIIFNDIKLNFSLAHALFFQAGNKDSQIVLLKIPTDKLNIKNLRCRAQNLKHPEYHDQNGDLAVNQKHYTRHKEAIEYIYTDTIPIKDVIKIGETNTKIITNEINSKKDIKKLVPLELISELLQGQPEIKSVELLKQSKIPFEETFRE